MFTEITISPLFEKIGFFSGFHKREKTTIYKKRPSASRAAFSTFDFSLVRYFSFSSINRFRSFSRVSSLNYGNLFLVSYHIICLCFIFLAA